MYTKRTLSQVTILGGRGQYKAKVLIVTFALMLVKRSARIMW